MEGREYIFVDDKKPDEIEINTKLRARLEKSEYSNFGGFMRNFGEPQVVLPDGDIIVPEYNLKLHFTDSIAEAFAEQNNGLFFPKYRTEYPESSFPLQRLIDVIKILAPKKESTLKLLANSSGLESLTTEVNNLKDGKIYPIAHKFGNGLFILEGFRGNLDLESLDLKCPRLGIRFDLGEFSYSHFGITRKTLYSKIYSKGFDKKSPEYSVLGDFVREHSKDRENGRLDISFDENERDIKVEFTSPHDFGSNSKIECPVMDTKEMAKYFSWIAKKIDSAVSGAEKYRENEKLKEEYHTRLAMEL